MNLTIGTPREEEIGGVVVLIDQLFKDTTIGRVVLT